MGIPDLLLRVGGALGVIGVVVSIIHGALTAALRAKQAPIAARLYAKRTLALSVVTLVLVFVFDAAAVALTSSNAPPGAADDAVHALVAKTLAAVLRTSLLLALPVAVAAWVMWKARAETQT